MCIRTSPNRTMEHVYQKELAMPENTSTAQKNLQGWIATLVSITIAIGSIVYYAGSISPRINALEKQSDKIDERLQRIEQNQITRDEWNEFKSYIKEIATRDRNAVASNNGTRRER